MRSLCLAMAITRLRLAVQNIKNTQLSVKNRIDGGHGSQVALVPWAEQVLRGSIMFQSLPQIRVSELDGKDYSIDNRRLFVLKALYLNEALMVQRMPWTEEFDNKLNGNGRGPWRTDEGGLQEFRWALLRHMNEASDPDPAETQHVFIQAGVFGDSRHEELRSFNLATDLDDAEGAGVGFYRGSLCSQVKLTVNKSKHPQFDYFGSCANELRLERADGCTEENFNHLCDDIRRQVNKSLLLPARMVPSAAACNI